MKGERLRYFDRGTVVGAGIAADVCALAFGNLTPLRALAGIAILLLLAAAYFAIATCASEGDRCGE